MTGVALIGVALIWQFQMPIIKRIWTCTMALFSGGICYILMGCSYYWIDYKKHLKGLEWLKIYGMNSIAAYIMGEFLNFRSVVESVCYGLAPYLGKYYEVWLTFGNAVIILIILRFLFKYQIFMKI